MQPRNDLERRSLTSKYSKIFPKLRRSSSMHEHQVYKSLSKLESSDFFGLCTDQIRALISLAEAKRYLTFLTLQNDKNKSNLDKISESQSIEEESRIKDIYEPLLPIGHIKRHLRDQQQIGSQSLKLHTVQFFEVKQNKHQSHENVKISPPQSSNGSTLYEGSDQEDSKSGNDSLSEISMQQARHADELQPGQRREERKEESIEERQEEIEEEQKEATPRSQFSEISNNNVSEDDQDESYSSEAPHPQLKELAASQFVTENQLSKKPSPETQAFILKNLAQGKQKSFIKKDPPNWSGPISMPEIVFRNKPSDIIFGEKGRAQL